MKSNANIAEASFLSDSCSGASLKPIYPYNTMLQKYRSHHEITNDTPSLKRKCLHFDEIFVTGCTGSCQNDNFQCNQWLKFRQNDIFVSVIPNRSVSSVRNLGRNGRAIWRLNSTFGDIYFAFPNFLDDTDFFCLGKYQRHIWLIKHKGNFLRCS